MDLMKEFEEYLPKWAEEKMQPIPTQEHTERWNIAWGDFLKEHLFFRARADRTNVRLNRKKEG